MTNSTHKVEVIRLNEVLPHPNADALDIIPIWGYTTCSQKDTFHVGDLAAFIPPDSIVPETPQFEFLQGHTRIKVKKLRGVVSYGFLIPAPEGTVEGQDIAELIGITHYEPQVSGKDPFEALPPETGYHPKYDVDALLRYPELFAPDEELWVTEKVDGTNARFTFEDGVFHLGSHHRWVDSNYSHPWSRIVKTCPEIEEFCRTHPGMTLYGEVYGVTKNKYNLTGGELRFVAFDIMSGGRWLDPEEARVVGATLPWVPLLNRSFRYDIVGLLATIDGKSQLPGASNSEREGVVLKPLKERQCIEIGRVCLKLVSPKYLEKN